MRFVIHGKTLIKAVLEDKDWFQSVTIPDHINKIGKKAFNECWALESIVLPKGVTEIEAHAFSDCSALKSVTLSEGINKIGEYAFSGCTALKSITLPESIDEIGERAFSACTALKSITLPDGLTQIKAYTFLNCQALKEAVLPESLTRIDADAFSYCTALTSITLPDGLIQIGTSAFYSCRALEEVILPPNLTKLEESTFSNCTALERIVLPENLTEIGQYACNNCTALETLILPKNITLIRNAAFYRCKALEEVILPENLTKLEAEAFYGCTALKSIALPKGITEIEKATFSYCTVLKSVTLPESITKIEDRAFAGCTALETIILPKEVTKLGHNVFYNCMSLKTITLSEGLTKIETQAFSGCTSLRTIELPENLKKIASYAFYDCTALKTITLPKDITKIEIGTFTNCSSLKDITLPEGLTMINESAFLGCATLESMELPDTIEEVGVNAFGNIKKVTYGATDITPLLVHTNGRNFQLLMELLKEMKKNDIPLTKNSAKVFCGYMHRNGGQIPDQEEMERYMLTGGMKQFKQQEDMESLKKLFQTERRRVPGIIDAVARLKGVGYKDTELVQGFDIKRVRDILTQRIPICPALVQMYELKRNQQDYMRAVGKDIYVTKALLKYKKTGQESFKDAAEWIVGHGHVSDDLVKQVIKKAVKLSFANNPGASDIRLQLDRIKAKKEMKKVEKKYEFKFEECAFNLKYSQSEIGGYKAYIMNPGDERMVTIGYDTCCCQHLGSDGETAMMHGLLHPNAGFWVIEDRNGKILAQAEIWEADGRETLVFDNIEFADDRDIGNILVPLTKWLEECEYRTVVMGLGYNEMTLQFEAAGGYIPELTDEELVKYNSRFNEEEYSAEELQQLIRSGECSYTEFVYTDAGNQSAYLKKDDEVTPVLLNEIVTTGMDYIFDAENTYIEDLDIDRLKSRLKEIVGALPESVKAKLCNYIEEHYGIVINREEEYIKETGLSEEQAIEQDEINI